MMISAYHKLGIGVLLALLSRTSKAAELKFHAPVISAPESPDQRYFGRSVAIADDFIIVGEADSESSGRAYAAVHMDDNWVVEELVPGAPLPISEYGWAVAADGEARVLIGAPPKAQIGGALFAFKRDADQWLGESVPTAGTDSYLGTAIAMSSSLALVADESFKSQQGAVYIFNYTGSQWQSVDTPAFPNTLLPGAHFGSALAILGNTAVIGARAENNYQGAIYTVTLDADLNDWERPEPVNLADNCEFGTSVALHSAWIIVGAPGCLGGTGTVFAYNREAKTWSTIDIPVGEALVDLGRTLAIDGDNLIISAPSMNGTGAVFLAVEQGGSWAASPPVFAKMPADNAQFGSSLAIVGARVVVGEPNRDDDFDGIGDGAVHEFEIVGSLADPCTVAEACASGVCADGVCCDAVKCADQCWVCSRASLGTCLFNEGAACGNGDGCDAGTCRSTSETSTGEGSSASGTSAGETTGGDEDPTGPTVSGYTSDSTSSGETDSTSSGETDSTSSGETTKGPDSGFDSLDWYPFEPSSCNCTIGRSPRAGDLLWLLPALVWRRRRPSLS